MLFVGLALAGLSDLHTAGAATVLGIDRQEFKLNGRPTFLLGISYYAGLGAGQVDLEQDLADAQQFGFNWLRVWATWNAFGRDVSAVTSAGEARQPFLGKLRSLVAECDRRGLVVDVTLARGNILTNLSAHERAVATVVQALKNWHNWYLDLANEHDVGDQRYVSVAELKVLRQFVRELDSSRLVTASFGGHDLDESDVRAALFEAGLDFLAPHRPRTQQSARETRQQTAKLLVLMQRLGRPVPILYQEPFRRGYPGWQATVADFLADLNGARAGGAAGWCFHNGSQWNTADHQPRRSFDLDSSRLFPQLDAVERQVVLHLVRPAAEKSE